MLTLTGLSSMATRPLLADLTAQYAATHGVVVEIESIGGVDAAKRVAAGEHMDLVFLASDAIAKLATAGHVHADSCCDWVVSQVAACARAGAPVPPWQDAADVRAAVLAARAIGVSTGPSGAALSARFAAWGIADVVTPRIVAVPPGTPVAARVADGAFDLGFQQLSELRGIEGVTLLGPLPGDCAIPTRFAGAVPITAPSAATARAFLLYLQDPQHAAAKRAHGMACCQ